MSGHAILINNNITECLFSNLLFSHSIFVDDHITKGRFHHFISLLFLLLFLLLLFLFLLLLVIFLLLLLELRLLFANFFINYVLNYCHDSLLVLFEDRLTLSFHAIKVLWLRTIESKRAYSIGSHIALWIIFNIFECVHEIVIS